MFRFRNAATGYERTYRVTLVKNVSEGGGGSKSSVCTTYQREYSYARLERTDSTSVYAGMFDLNINAAMGEGTFQANLQWQSTTFALPIDKIENGQLVLTPLTLGGRTYPAVFDISNNSQPTPTRPNSVTVIYVTKAEGVVGFVERGGSVWHRR